MTIAPGLVLDGRYRIDERLARGGMAEVWAAVDLATNAGVAVKVLDVAGLDGDHLAERFQREARAVARIASPFVCAVLASGRYGDEEDALYIVLERLHGETLGDRLRQHPVMPVASVTPWLDHVMRGLADAHAVGVVHRDLKPSNVFLEKLGDGGERAKVLDFGVSKIVEDAPGGWGEPVLTREDATLGSFAYMAPEQVEGAHDVDGRADVYAAGLLAFRALSGRLPFGGHGMQAMLALKVDQDAPTLAEVTGVLWPASIESFFRRMLARSRDERPATAAEARELWHFSIEGAPVTPAVAGDSRPLAADVAATDTATLPRRR